MNSRKVETSYEWDALQILVTVKVAAYVGVVEVECWRNVSKTGRGHGHGDVIDYLKLVVQVFRECVMKGYCVTVARRSSECELAMQLSYLKSKLNMGVPT